MKRILAVLFLLVPLMAGAACSDQNAVTDTASQGSLENAVSNEEAGTGKNGMEADANQDNSTEETADRMMRLKIGDSLFTATLADNSTTAALKEMLADGPVTIEMQDYGNMEKVGTLGVNLPRNDEPITTQPGDLILYQGNRFVIYYETNSWDFTRIGKIDNVTQEELKEALGAGDVRVTISIE